MGRTPCKECRTKHKKCVWKNGYTEVCDRCARMEIDCVSLGFYQKSTQLTSSGDLDELRNWWTSIAQLETDMQELEVMKARLQQNSANKQQPQLEWQLSITNGVLKLETPIRTIYELDLFGKASLRYLSPFTGIFKKQSIRFESESVSLTHGVWYIMHRRDVLQPHKRQPTIGNTSDNRFSRSCVHDHRTVIDYIVPIYLKHHNHMFGLLHQPTFLEYFRRLDDPTNDALVLAICVDALAQIRHLLKYNSSEIRVLIDIFYDRCRDLLFDMYDDPTKKFQIIMTTTLLQQYVSDVALNFAEARRIISLALLVCSDVAKSREEMTPVERVLFQRHYFHLEMLNRTHRMLDEDKIDFIMPTSTEIMEVLDDEPEKTKEYMAIANHIFRLIGAPYVCNMMGNINHLFCGESCEIPFEDLLQYEPLIKDWWASLPTKYQVCENPFDPNGYKLVEGKVSSDYYPFIILHLIIATFTSSILQPGMMPSSESTVATEAVQLVREKSASLALNSCKVIIYALQENWDPYACDWPSFSLSIMLYGIYCLEKLSCCTDIRFPLDLLSMLTESIAVKSKVLLPAGHTVPLSSSLLTFYLNNSKTSLYKIYENYAFPGCAMLSDLLFTSANRLVERHLTVAFNVN